MAESYDCIMADITKHLTINELSLEVNASPSAIKAAFKGVYGTNIYSFLKTTRLLEVQRLFRETDDTITEIALQVGYSNPGKLPSAFRERFGYAPIEYRNLFR